MFGYSLIKSADIEYLTERSAEQGMCISRLSEQNTFLRQRVSELEQMYEGLATKLNNLELEMPLIRGEKAKTPAGKKANIRAEIKAGKPKDQAVAIAMSVASENKTKRNTRPKK